MNNNAPEIEVARKSLDKLLLELSVAKVVVVDDFFEKEFDHETIIGWLSIPDSEIPETLSARFEEIDFSNPEVWKMQFFELWDNLGGNEKRDLALLVSEKLGKSLEDDRKIDQNLVALFGEKVLCLSPSDWDKKKENILERQVQQKNYFAFLIKI